MDKEKPKSCYECTNNNQDYYPCARYAIDEAKEKGKQAGASYDEVWRLVQEYRRENGCIR